MPHVGRSTSRTICPIYELLKTNFPALARVKTEAGSSVFLGDIAEALQGECSDDESTVIRHARAIDVAELDSTLPSQPLETWLNDVARVERIAWRMSEDCDVKRQNVPEPPEGWPLCVGFGFRRGDVLVGSGLLTVGTLRGGISGSPKLQFVAAHRKDGGRSQAVRTLSALPSMLDALAARP
jgi:hypothetical protein